MKIKLKVTKTMKRTLKIQAEKQLLERVDYTIALLKTHLSACESLWQAEVKEYPDVLKAREEALIALKATLEDAEPSERASQLKLFYEENHYYRDFTNKNRKLENLILPVDDDVFYGLSILAEKNAMTLHRYVVDLLQQKI